MKGGIVTKAIETSFITEITQLKEKINLKKTDLKLKGLAIKDKFSKVQEEDIKNWNKDLKKEIIYWGQYVGDLSKISKDYAKKHCEDIFNTENILDNLYYVDTDIAEGKEKAYIYDNKTDIVYKIDKTIIAFKIVHSLKELNDLKGTTTVQSPANIIRNESEVVSVNNISHYEPNLNGFALDKTSIIYYDENIETSISISAKDYIENGKLRTIERDGKIYEFYNYELQKWANILIENNGMQTYWVWIPRYAYKENDVSDIKFIDLKTTPAEGYTVHSAFEDGKKGIWVSKYEPIQTANLSVAVEDFPHYLPDLTGFNDENTYVEVYEPESQLFKEIKLKDIDNIKTFAKNNNWFNYEKQIWANIKTVNPETNVESWWVWIPRYAYTITGNNISIIFIDLKNNPLDGTDLPSNYVVHSAFENEKRGIWASKYEPIQKQIEGN